MKSFMDACNRVFRAAAACTPQGSMKSTVNLYLTAIRNQLEWLERSRMRQLKSWLTEAACSRGGASLCWL